MIGDEEISAGLQPLRPIGYSKVPVEGEWRQAPFAERVLPDRVVAVVCEDPGVAMVTVDRRSGEVLLVGQDGGSQLVNSSVELLVQCAQVYRKARRAARRVEDDDEALEALAAQTLAEVGRIDAVAVRDENQLWATAIEEIEYDI